MDYFDPYERKISIEELFDDFYGSLEESELTEKQKLLVNNLLDIFGYLQIINDVTDLVALAELDNEVIENINSLIVLLFDKDVYKRGLVDIAVKKLKQIVIWTLVGSNILIFPIDPISSCEGSYSTEQHLKNIVNFDNNSRFNVSDDLRAEIAKSLSSDDCSTFFDNIYKFLINFSIILEDLDLPLKVYVSLRRLLIKVHYDLRKINSTTYLELFKPKD